MNTSKPSSPACLDCVEQSIATVLERVTDAFYAVDADWRFTYLNERAALLLRQPAQALLGRDLWRAFPAARGSIVEREYRHAMAEQVPVSFETYFAPLDLWVEVSAYPSPDGLSVYFRDIAERKRAEAALRRREQEFVALAEHATDAIQRFDRELRFLYVNAATQQAAGMPAARFIGRTHADPALGFEPALVAAFQDNIRAVFDTALPREFAVEYTGPQGPRWYDVRLAPEFDGQDRVESVLAIGRDITAQRLAEATLRASVERFRALSACVPVGIFESDNEGQTTYINPRLQEIWGATEAEMLGRGWTARVHPDDLPGLLEGWQAALDAHADYGLDYRLRMPDGSIRHVEGHSAPLRDASGAVIGSVGSIWDVTERRRIEQALAESERSLRLALIAGRMSAWVLDPASGMVREHAGDVLSEAGGADAEGRSRPWTDWLAGLLLEDRPRIEEALERTCADGAEFDEEARTSAPDGHPRWLQLRGRALLDARGWPRRVVGISLDITERKELESELMRRAYHDALTSLENRTRFRERVAAALENAADDAPPLAVLFVDLDDFKTVNDSLGHAVGDHLLVLVAGRLRKATRGCDTVARLGGDEFAVLLGVNHGMEDAVLAAERIVGSIGAPFVLAGHRIRVGASVGIALARPGDTPEDLLRNADLAMYRAKHSGKGRHETFTPEMHAAALDRLTLNQDLHRAIDAREFELRFQPIVGLATQRIVGAETLLRWRHPARGTMTPDAFIPAAEESGLILPLGRWVLAEACRAAALWPRSADAAVAVTVNVSARQLSDPGFVDDVRMALGVSGLPPDALVLEVTESVLMHDRDSMVQCLRTLKQLGVQIAVDDFGTGFSSLAYLQRFPVDVLKIDKSFVDMVAQSSKDAALARTIIGLADSLGLRSVAEGVEQLAQQRQLELLGCQCAQGYLYARPMAAPEFRGLLAAAQAGMASVPSDPGLRANGLTA